jgi:poly(A) polymerase
MIPALSIEPPDWMTSHESRDLMALLNNSGDTPQALFVGGCVRNAVLGREVQDLDIATRWHPQDVAEKCHAAGLKVIPTGIDHGTVTVVVDQMVYEITTLRRDVSTDGRRATVVFSKDWQEDAARRDFTMNALYADEGGRIYDPLDKGVDDLKAGRVIFVGNPAQRIAEDVLRILRFFRFHAYYGQGQPSSEALQACQEAADQLQTLSRERITQEFFKILMADGVVPLLELMFMHNVLDCLPHPGYQPEDLESLLKLQDQFDQHHVLPRLFLLMNGSMDQFFAAEKYLIYTNEQKKHFEIYHELFLNYDCDQAIPIKHLIYKHNKDLVKNFILICAATRSQYDPTNDIQMAEDWPSPELPVDGRDVLENGVRKGPEVGELLKQVENWWIDHDFQPDRAQCLKKLAEFIQSRS